VLQRPLERPTVHPPHEILKEIERIPLSPTSPDGIKQLDSLANARP
jgi:hypothetical protein